MKRIIMTCFLLFSFYISSMGQDGNFLAGKIVEKNTGRPIAYASITGITGAHSVVSNGEGSFLLPYKNKSTDTVIVSAIGFNTARVAPLLSHSLVIELEKSITLLNSVVITPVKVENILKQAIKKSRASYYATSIITGYYKEYVKRDSSLSKYADGIISYYIQRQKNDLPKVSLQVSQSRVKEIVMPAEEDKANELNTQINIKEIGAFVDPCKTSTLDSNNFKYYKYQLLEIVNDGKPIYVINFSPLTGDKKSLYSGKIYIDKDSMLIIGLDYVVSPLSIAYLPDISVLGINVNITSHSLHLRYKVKNDEYCLTYVGQHYEMKIKSRLFKFNQLNSFNSEFWVTNTKTDNISPFTENVYTKKVLYKRGSVFKSAFWEQFKFTENTKDEMKFLIDN